MKIQQKQSGFTLIELLVSVAILSMITLSVVVNFRDSDKTKELSLTADNLASFIRKAQIWSMTGRQTNGRVPVGGYGVALSNCSVAPCKATMFADLDGSLSFNSAGNPLGLPVTTVEDEKAEEIGLGSSIGLSGGGVYFLFRPPDGFLCVYTSATGVGCPLNSGTLAINIYNISRPGFSKSLIVSTVSGQIKIQ